MPTQLIILPLLFTIMLTFFGTASYAAPVTEITQDFSLQKQLQRADKLIEQAQYEQALILLSEIYNDSKERQDSVTRNTVLNSIANIYYNTGQLDQAYRYYTELVTLDNKNSDPSALAVSLFNLGHVNASRKQFSKADDNFKQSLTISRTLADDAGIAATLKAMGVNAEAQSKFTAARKYLLESLHRFVAIHDKAQAARVQRHLGDIAYQQQGYEQAIEHYLAALSVFQKQPFSKALMRTHRGLSMAYEKKSDLAQALEHHQRYASLQQQLSKQQNKDATKRLQVQFETQRFASENVQLAFINQKQELELDHSQTQLKFQYVLMTLAIAVLLLVIALWYRSKQHAKAMQLLAARDELTGIQNRRAIMQFAMKEWHRATRFDRPYCCFAIDIDHFKAVNDTWGHATGDSVLKRIANTIQSTLRVTDSVGRIGGEEFLLISIETDIEQAVALAERIRSKIEHLIHETKIEKPITISIGVAQLEKQISLEQLISNADAALYQSKNNGRNRVTIYQEMQS